MTGISFRPQASQYDYGRFASGKKIQRAADGAAELSIIQKQAEQILKYQSGRKNIGAGQSLANIADGAQAGITDYLQRIDELAVRASNSLMSDSDRQAIQSEIDMMKDGISQIASTTNYNGKNLLDGSNPDINIATGSGSMNLANSDSTLEALGIADFDVTGDFDLKKIDEALSKVSAGRSRMGAQSNALDHAYRINRNAAYQTTVSQSRMGDLDYPKAISDQRKKEALQQYSFYMQRAQMRMDGNKMIFFE